MHTHTHKHILVCIMHVDGTCWRFGWFLHEITCFFVKTNFFLLLSFVRFAVLRFSHIPWNILTQTKDQEKKREKKDGKCYWAEGERCSRKDEHFWQIIWLPIKLAWQLFFGVRVSPEFPDGESSGCSSQPRTPHFCRDTNPLLITSSHHQNNRIFYTNAALIDSNSTHFLCLKMRTTMFFNSQRFSKKLVTTRFPRNGLGRESEHPHMTSNST